METKRDLRLVSDNLAVILKGFVRDMRDGFERDGVRGIADLGARALDPDVAAYRKANKPEPGVH